jgi:soluble P-type ATPase
MITIDIPGSKKFQLNHLVLDYNGTLACDGILFEGVEQKLDELSAQIQIHVLTADTFGQVKAVVAGLACQLSILPPGNQHLGKLNYVEALGPETTVCIGNGRNDRLMLQEAALGIAVLQEEGTAVEAILAADVVAPDILAALNLLTNPLRLVASLRS